MSIQNRIENYWNSRAGDYSESIQKEMNSFQINAWRKLISENAPSKANIKALDIGTGPGFFTIVMSDLGYKVTAVDCTENMLSEARKNVERAGFTAEFLQGDCHQLPFEDASFDLIVCRNLVWTLVDPIGAYCEWYRLLKPEGKLLIFDANWYLRLTDPELQKRFEEDRKRIVELGYEPSLDTLEEESSNIGKDLYLTFRVRPQWDAEAFLNQGFKKIFIDKDITELVWDEERKVRYRCTPMFLAGAEK
ncbi:Ubiquinone/menaquinone biosynthesis C-methylase UbiE [Anaerovirgula multivorans]|uniref:Ubiquinone/menaquinone biosynthesis C-methylase UbiE n=1 Tax=Anaerovirgula multivorans TaxID=312168 RepID=A0A239ILB5_9FIRM|nr:class I SAM-dependent methyltransferase [Anaerovirgula multivorans]SNS93843.1 Ubiquinone/menaquinone biosynthesis C-methylase UbiE [Anaerovirgula multivorans]